MWLTLSILSFLAVQTAPGQGPAAARDEADIRALVRQYVEARQLEDPAAIAALFTADADQHTTAGEWRRGRAQLVPGALASSKRNPGTRAIRIESIRFLTPEVAIADGPYEIAAGSEVRRMWTTLVVVRDAGAWRIAAIRNMVPTGAP